MWNVTLYYGTKCNAVNTVDGSATLARATALTLPALDILKGDRLREIKVKATPAQCENVDYLILWDSTHKYFFSVYDYTPTSYDVQTLYITDDYWQDYIEMIGGIGNVEFLDGITERHHIALADDTFGAYTEEDPYLIPSKPLELIKETTNSMDMITGTTGKRIVESTLDLYEMSQQADGVEYVATSGEAVVVPQTIPVSNYTNITFNSQTIISPNTAYFSLSGAAKTHVEEGISRLRSLGVESAILNSYVLPLASLATPSDANGNATTGMIDSIEGSDTTMTVTDLPFEYATVNNKRVLYGELNEYLIVSPASGNQATFKPEDIYVSGATAPTVRRICDVRPGGKPYYRFNSYLGATDNFFLNCISGLEWANAPLVYYDKSGSEIDTMKYQTEQSIRKQTYQDTLAEMDKSYKQAIAQDTGNRLTGLFSGRATEPTEVLGRGIGLMASQLYSQNRMTDLYLQQVQNTTDQYVMQSEKERQEFWISQNVVIPTVNFPRSTTLRDFLGNGIYVYRYKPQASDITKLDKILTMYGYRDTAPLTATMLNNRSKFNYIKAVGVSVGGDVPKWVREGVAQQFSAGLRIWHQLPDPTIYTNGTNT